MTVSNEINRGMNTMRELNMALIAAGLFAVFTATAINAASAQQQMSDRSVQTIMDYAWTYTPDKYTSPRGNTIIVDRKQREKMVVPLPKAREVIMVGRLSAHAQICNLLEDQVKNHRSLMLREEQSDKWSPQQLFYIHQLHLTTVLLLTGKVGVEGEQGSKKVVVKEGPAQSKTCTDEQKARVKELIAKYVAAGPDLTKSAQASN